MLVAMKELKVAFGDDEKKYNSILKMIEPRFKNNLSGMLRKVGYFLNPFFYYPAYTDIEGDGSFMKAVVECMHRLYSDDHVTFTKIGDLIPNYQERPGLYGNDTPELMEIYTKKRNMLTHKILHDLVFVKFNAKLKNKHAVIDRDPLTAYDDEERVSEWLLREEGNNSDDEVFPGECLTFRQVEDISKANTMKRKSGRLKMYKRKK
ncbi:uncharacterized protein LOC109821455 [Asparagus officinalis]|uniref:uncharacterized protein LOC109821455 n=1 Tax=Asparagus officinalis TaxID=4686 RepID=UPI00098DE7DE|nr:uncharacterized protein LOC109821455 [Asparagus officinalis]